MEQEDQLKFEKEPSRYIEERIKLFVKESDDNRLHEIDDSPIFEEPLVGFADGDDPLFSEYKKIIGSFHLTPREALERSLEQQPLARAKDLGAVGVICWVLPIAKRTRMSTRVQELVPSFRWSHTRYYGERFNDSLRRHVVALLQERGYLAGAPMIAPFFERFVLPDGRTSNWSERHALYTAGLGTFSLSDGFITPKGIAMRCGSVVTNLRLPPTPRKYATHTANCPFLQNRSCGECIDRCPAGAISARGHDKNKCFLYLHDELAPLKKRYGVEIVGCGLCQTRVPCESRIPPPHLFAKTEPVS